MKTIFQKIIEGELPANKRFENERLLVIDDIQPVAPTHLLIIPKKPYKDLSSIPKQELDIVQEVMSVAQDLAKEMGLLEGYRVITNNGEGAGQTVFHLHFHLIGGKTLSNLC